MLKLGKRIRELRKLKKITLVELSNASKVALATLSRMENEKMTGTVESHMAIAKVLGITLSELYSDIEISQTQVIYLGAQERSDKFSHGENVLYEMLTKDILAKKMLPLLLTIETASKSNLEQAPVGTEKFIYCLEGKIKVTVVDKDYTLNKSDSLYFDASLKHYIENTGKKKALAVCIMTPPVL